MYLLCSDSVTYVLLKPCLLNINHYITFSLCSFSALSVIYDCRDCFITIWCLWNSPSQYHTPSVYDLEVVLALNTDCAKEVAACADVWSWTTLPLPLCTPHRPFSACIYNSAPHFACRAVRSPSYPGLRCLLAFLASAACLPSSPLLLACCLPRSLLKHRHSLVRLLASSRHRVQRHEARPVA